MMRVLGCLTQDHDPRLVALAACICVLGCITTASLLARAQAVPDRASVKWLLVAAAVFGSSVWALHFVAMLAFLPGLPIAYEVRLTALSILIAVVGAALALLTWRFHAAGRFGIPLSGALVGLAVTGMHYAGVAAMRLPGRISYDKGFVTASVLISIGCGAVALLRARHLVRFRRRLEVAGWLAVSICGLHFTGMAALEIEMGFPVEGKGAILGTDSLAVAVGGAILAILAASFAAAMLDQHLSHRTLQELGRMRLLSNLAQEAMLIHRRGEVLEANSAANRLFGLPTDRMVGRPLLDLFAEESRPVLIRRSRCRPEELAPEEVGIQTADGRQVTVELSCQHIDFQGKPATAVALRDLTDRKRDEARIRHLAHHDVLTDLPNRTLLEERLLHAIDAARIGDGKVAVLYLDLDRFKPVNDLLGHNAGDTLLIAAAGRLRARLRSADTLARVGGDEFVAVLMNTEVPERVSEVAARLIAALTEPFEIDGRRVEIGVSIGIALHPMDGDSPEALLRSADTAMYRAKEDGRGGLRFFERSMDAELQRRRQLEHELRHAVERGELLLHFQPVVNGRSGEIDGFEALMRWRHPVRGLVPPAEFIPLAEDTGLIIPIGQWALEEACRVAAGWPRPWWVAVNLSPAQFRQPGLPGIVSAALARGGLEPSRLEIEITEGVLIQDAERAIEVLSALRALGLRVALDDFGTGYSSLSYLRLFALDKIKVDKSFVQDLGRNKEATMIVNAIINLGHNLGLSITVEGVESQRQLAVLREQRCDLIQGYLFGRPAAEALRSPEEMERIRSTMLGLAGQAEVPFHIVS